jgi:catechol 2,3-dioxygenase-like lactoylglutathione lyase family enzyme
LVLSGAKELRAMYQPIETHPNVHIGHVHLRVADLERATAFYREVLGFDVTAYIPANLAHEVGYPAGGEPLDRGRVEILRSHREDR